MELKDLQNSTKSSSSLNYKWIPIYAAPNLHEKAYEILSGLQIDKDSKILVLGTWWGAFDQRLLDNWFKNITSVDINRENYNIKWTTFIQKDLNDNFTDLWNFDIIICLEVIEHLKNPYNFLWTLKNILKEKGYLIISTPNIENNFSRWYFLFFWNLDYFSNADLLETWHITPIIQHIFNFFCENNWLKILSVSYNRSVFDRMISLKSRFFSLMIKAITLFNKKKNIWEINIYLISHND